MPDIQLAVHLQLEDGDFNPHPRAVRVSLSTVLQVSLPAWRGIFALQQGLVLSAEAQRERMHPLRHLQARLQHGGRSLQNA